MNWLNVLERAGWTAVQSFTSAFVGLEAVTDIEGAKSIALSASIAAGASLISFVKTVAQERLAQLGS